jgi:1-pyrroline-4-hydroxy-2-carboxylate deaminase
MPNWIARRAGDRGGDHRHQRDDVDRDDRDEYQRLEGGRQRMADVERPGNLLIRHAPEELEERGSGREGTDAEGVEEVGGEADRDVGGARCASAAARALAREPAPGVPGPHQREGSEQRVADHGLPCRVIRRSYTIFGMSAQLACTWSGVYPAATTQFNSALELDVRATQEVQAALLRDAVHGLVLIGTVGEGNSLSAEEKRTVVRAAVEVARGRVPVIAGVSEFTTAAAVSFVRDAERLGASGFMVLPAMVYVPTPAELEYHFRTVAAATGLPVMLYNNPPSYRVNIEIATLARLAEVPNIVALKESAPDPRRFTDLINAFGERFVLFAGLDDVVFEALTLGARGWVSGLTNAFPAESLALYEALRDGDLERARRIYRWFMPLLHLDSEPDLVQSIKLAEQILGRGSERVRPPRLPLAGERRAQVTALVERARATRPA